VVHAHETICSVSIIPDFKEMVKFKETLIDVSVGFPETFANLIVGYTIFCHHLEIQL